MAGGIRGTTRVRVVQRRAPVGFVSIRPTTLGAWIDQRLDYNGAVRVVAANGTSSASWTAAAKPST
ncbi:MAG: hypothetical protein ACRENP_12710 [Longimicrobiales bacterium]